MQDLNITLVRSKIKDRPYCKIDGVYSGRTWKNDIGLQKIKNDIESLYQVCQKLSETPEVCMVYGTARKAKIRNTDRTMANFVEEPTRILTLDLDTYEGGLKDEYPTYQETVKEADIFIRTHLPPEFQNTSYIIRFSSSFLTKGYTFKAHLVFLLEDSQYPREIGTWLKQENIPADSTFYLNLTQPIFTAAPQFHDKLDPLVKTGNDLPRVSLVKKENNMVAGGWQPYSVKKREPIDFENLPKAIDLPGKIGSFCRMFPIEKALIEIGYERHDDDRFLAPTSQTGLPGVKIFPNGYCFSHHSDDPIHKISDKLFLGKRYSFNSHDLVYGWAKINREEQPELMDQFQFLLSEAVLADQEYQDEIIKEFIFRTEWLVEDGYTGDNKIIIDSLLFDISKAGLNEMSRDYIFGMIVVKTNKKITKSVLKNTWKYLKKDEAFYKNEYDPEAGIRTMASIFLKKRIVYSHHKSIRGEFWCYYQDVRMWKRLNRDQTDAFIYKHLHTAMPVKKEIHLKIVEDVTKVILKAICESYGTFKPGSGWAFKGGKIGILTTDIFKKEWTLESGTKTLKREYHICKELPITYDSWKNSNGSPPKFNDFLVSSCEEDYHKVELIQEYVGYIFSDSYYLHNFLILEGVPGSGKSILLKIIRSCLGPSYYAAASLGRVGGAFGIGELPGKMLAVISEARELDFNLLRAAVPIILKITGNDPVDVEAKYKSALTEVLSCKLMIVTNRTPVIPDDTGALVQRMIMIKLHKSFRGTSEEILGLDDIIVDKEITQIIQWAFRGLERLAKRKQFEISDSIIKESGFYIDRLNPLKAFIADYFTMEEDSNANKWVKSTKFTQHFREYLFRIGQIIKVEKIQKRVSAPNLLSVDGRLRRLTVRDGPDTYAVIEPLIPNKDLDIEFASERSELMPEQEQRRKEE